MTQWFSQTNAITAQSHEPSSFTGAPRQMTYTPTPLLTSRHHCIGIKPRRIPGSLNASQTPQLIFSSWRLYFNSMEQAAPKKAIVVKVMGRTGSRGQVRLHSHVSSRSPCPGHASASQVPRRERSRSPHHAQRQRPSQRRRHSDTVRVRTRSQTSEIDLDMFETAIVTVMLNTVWRPF